MDYPSSGNLALLVLSKLSKEKVAIIREINIFF